MSEVNRQAAAKVLAATLTLMGRELLSLPPPLNLWTGELSSATIKETALEVATGRAEVLWCEDNHPAQGLMLCRPQDIEASLLGLGSYRLSGPWMVELDQNLRYQKTRTLAAKAKAAVSRLGGQLNKSECFLSVKTWHDPAILRGFIDEGFQLAEILTKFSGPIASLVPKEPDPSERFKPAGVSLRKPHTWEFTDWFRDLGDLFYDGHLLHGPYFEGDFHKKLWFEVAVSDFSSGSPLYFLWQDRPEKIIGLAWGRVSGPYASLSAIHIAEERRGQGLGFYLLESLCKKMQVMGGRDLTVETSSWNLPAQGLYRSIGLAAKAPLAALHLLFKL